MAACQSIIPLVYLSSVEPTVYHLQTLFLFIWLWPTVCPPTFLSVYLRKMSVHLTHCLSACQFIHRQARRMNIDGVESNYQVQFSSTLDIRLYLADFLFLILCRFSDSCKFVVAFFDNPMLQIHFIWKGTGSGPSFWITGINSIFMNIYINCVLKKLCPILHS